MKSIAPLLIILLFLALFGCSSTSYMYPSEPVTEMRVYFSRAALNLNEFEQYRVKNDTVYAECGRIRRGKHIIEAEYLPMFSSEKMSQLRALAREAYGAVSSRKESFDKPGDSDSLFDPGVMNVSLSSAGETVTVNTSLDSIADPSLPAERRLGELVSFLRGNVGAAPCGNRSFYGLPMEEG